MIVFQAKGGLGNQLFQYAAARALALRHGVELRVDSWWYEHPPPGVTPRRLELLDLNVACSALSEPEAARLWTLRTPLAPALSWVAPLQLVQEPRSGVQPDLSTVRSMAYLKGYWQSERHFAHIRAALVDEIEPRLSAPALQEVEAAVAHPASVALHVRRGDYVSSPSAAQRHGVCSIDYYRAATALVRERVSDARFVVFSDDIGWACENLDMPAATFVEPQAGAHPAHDLLLMSRCAHNIIANSSYSWWGAWLGRPQGRIVVAPSRWFASGEPAADLIPERWLTL